MVRILNINLSNKSKISQSLKSIKGIGKRRASIICANLNIDEKLSFDQISKDKVKEISDFIDSHYLVLNKLTREKTDNIKRLIRISSYRGFRQVGGLPSRGQRTHTNRKTASKFKIKL